MRAALLALVILAGCGGGEDEREPYVSCWAKHEARVCDQGAVVACARYSTTDPACQAIK